jgi:hypothetical protein
VSAPEAVVLEDGTGFVLLENTDGFLLLESSDDPVVRRPVMRRG